MRRWKTHFTWWAIGSVGCATPTLGAATVNVFAAASLTDSLKEIAAAYEKQTGDKIVFNFGASSFLARQIEEGAPAEVFFSADEARMDGLEKKGLVVKETRKSRLSNSLVIVVTADSMAAIKSARDLAEWTSVESKIVPTDNVRAALAAVESGNVEVGLVYKTDAAISKKVKVACEVPASANPAISYPMAVLKEAKEPEAAKRFLEHLDSEEAGRVFNKFGFIVRN